MKIGQIDTYAYELERDNTGRFLFLLSLYLVIVAISTWYGTKRGYRVLFGSLMSFFVTPVLASLMFSLSPKDKK